MLSSVDKGLLLDELKRFVADKTAYFHAALESDDPGESRIRWSNYADNLLALERITDARQAIVLVEQEDCEFYEKDLVSRVVYTELAVKVPNPLSGRLFFEGREFRLTNHNSWYDQVVPGEKSQSSSRRDERWWGRKVILDRH